MKKILLVILGLLTAVCAFSQSDLQPAATINLIRTEAITVAQLRTRVQQTERENGITLTQSQRLQMLDVMIGERLILQAAERDRITVTDNEINAQLRESLAEQLGRQPTDAEFSQAMTGNNLHIPANYEDLRRTAVMQRYISTAKSALLNSVTPPTEAEINEFFSVSRNNFIRVDYVNISSLIIPYDADAVSRARARTTADTLHREINNNLNAFDEKFYATNPSLNYRSDEGWIPRNQEAASRFGQEFMNIIFSLRQGAVSPVVETPIGFLIVKVTGNLPFKALELSDAIQPGVNMTVREYIFQGLYTQKYQDAFQRGANELIVELRGRAQVQTFENNIRW
ncbi:MAG: peptidyl-prolyl cis-trans isomerase [Treponema sp.]|nr:peptidyl-prolyl cis-trans isomerase [Treponema sp.]